MQNHESIFELIDRCDFPNENPFELSEDLFPILNSVASPSITKLFEKTCYNSWVIFGFNGESKVSVFYDTILQKLDNGYLDNYYGHLDHSEVTNFKNKFVEIIHDELKHREIFSAIISKMGISNEEFDPTYYDPKCEEFVDFHNDLWNKYNLLDFLCNISTGESYLLSAFVLFYKYTKCQFKKQMFKEFIQEESRHIAHFMNFLKKATVTDQERERFHIIFLNWVVYRLQFEYDNLEIFLDKVIKDNRKKEIFLNLAYKTPLHNTFKKIYLKKVWQFYNIVFPDVDQESFEKLVTEYKKYRTCDPMNVLANKQHIVS